MHRGTREIDILRYLIPLFLVPFIFAQQSPMQARPPGSVADFVQQGIKLNREGKQDGEKEARGLDVRNTGPSLTLILPLTFAYESTLPAAVLMCYVRPQRG
jgi:hypothetical protein